MTIDYSILPEHMQEGMRAYIEHCQLPGGFLTAVLETDLMRAFECADECNAYRMNDYARFLYNEAPSNCYGSTERVERWCGIGGLEGWNKFKEIANAEQESDA